MARKLAINKAKQHEPLFDVVCLISCSESRFFLLLLPKCTDDYRPREMTTKEYSAAWKQIKASQRVVMPHTFRTMDDGLNFLRQFLSFSVVQVIGTEAICAASGWSQEIFCHCKPTDKQMHLQLTFKCVNDTLIQTLLNDFYIQTN